MRFSPLPVLFAVLIVVLPGSSQVVNVARDADRADNLILDGKYNEALDFLRVRIRFARIPNEVYKAGILYAYSARAMVELGRLDEAERPLRTAQHLAQWDQSCSSRAVSARVSAALYLARREYPTAAKEASKAHELARRCFSDSSRSGYCLALESQARLRMGDLKGAATLAGAALERVSDDSVQFRCYSPRILYTMCIVQSHLGNCADAVKHARTGLQLASRSGRSNWREISLGKLALAEAYLRRGDFARGRAHGLQALQVATDVFGRSHPDVVSALELLALVELKQGRKAEALARARETVSVAVPVFGEGSAAVTDLKKSLEPALQPGDGS